MQTIVERVRQIIDSCLPLKFWAESISTMVYLKICSPSPAMPGQAITLIQTWYKGNLSAIEHIRIFGFTIYVFDKFKPKPKFALKTWTRFIIDYKRHNEYCIYNSI